MSRIGVRTAQRRAGVAERAEARSQGKRKTTDSFQNFTANVGLGTDNISSGSTYGFNPITRNRILLEWIHRGSWIGGMAVDVVADDMTRAGVEIKGDDVDPVDVKVIEEEATRIGMWQAINDGTRWARLYGGSVVVPLIAGQNMSEPLLNPDRVERGALKGFMVLDRWMADPTLEDLVSEFGPNYGMPKYYRVNGDAPGLRGVKVHHSRVLRQEGDRLPYWQRLMENMWGTSVYERLYDRLVAFDSATQGAAQLVYKCWLRVLTVDKLREIVSSGGAKMAGLVKYVDNLRRFQSLEGIALIDGADKFEALQHDAFGGLDGVLMQFGQQIAGALQIPLVRLFGMSPAGFNATGESDLKTYYDGILQRQEKNYRGPVTMMYRCLAASCGVQLPPGFNFEFKPLWQMDEKTKAEVAKTITETVIAACEALQIPVETGLKELSKSSDQTGVWTHIDEEVIEAVKDLSVPTPALDAAIEQNKGTGETHSFGDHASVVSRLGLDHNFQFVVENPRGSVRQGVDAKTGEAWSVRMPASYGYLRGTVGADGDQVDCYIGLDASSKKVFVVHQNDRHTGKYDEDKVLLGFPNREQALMCYTMGHSHAAEVFGSMEEITLDQLTRRLLPDLACTACASGDCVTHQKAA